MNGNIKKVEDKIQNIEFPAVQMNQENSKNNLFITKKFNDPEKGNEKIKNKDKKFVSNKKQFFKVQNTSTHYKKKSLPNPLINDGR